MGQKPTLPNSVSTLVLGICSIASPFLFLGFVLSIIGIAISGTATRIYRENPTEWDGYSMLTAGHVLCIVGLVISSIDILFSLYTLLFAGTICFWSLIYNVL